LGGTAQKSAIKSTIINDFAPQEVQKELEIDFLDLDACVAKIAKSANIIANQEYFSEVEIKKAQHNRLGCINTRFSLENQIASN
jgi:uncharacterized protein (UPF0210 family)